MTESIITLSEIYLLLLCPCPLLKSHGMHTVMNPVTMALSDLLSGGLVVGTDCFEVSLEFVCGDSLGLHKLAGYQQSFSSGSRPCRTCYAKNDEFGTKLTEEELTLRTIEGYKAELESLGDGEDSAAQRETGLRGRCVFDELPNFNVLDKFPPDIAHDLFEGGVVNHTLGLVLSLLIFQLKLFSMASLKIMMKTFRYARMDGVNKPPAPLAKGRRVSVKGTFSNVGPC